MIRNSVYIFCKCGTWLHCGINISATHARQIAKAAGWRPSASHGDLCPACIDLRVRQTDPPLLSDDVPGWLLAERERDAIEPHAPEAGWGVAPIEGWPV
jgi:hypothetical protein